MNEAVREMTFEKEAKFYEEEARAEFAKETEGCDCSAVNGILRRGMRIIRKARQEIESLIAGQETLQKYIAEQKAEIERLENSGIRANSVDDWLKHCNELRAEAIKEFAERLKNSILPQLSCSTLEKKEAYYFCLDNIENLVKEMVGD